MAQQRLDKDTVEQLVIPELISLNPDCKQFPEGNVGRWVFDKDGNLETADLHGCRLQQLPDSITLGQFSGDLDLGGNQLTHLPDRFGAISVGRHLWLNNNSLEELPAGFDQVVVGGTLNLDQAFAHGKAPKLEAGQFPSAKHFLGGVAGH
eukprot:TRINITY_DN7293_c0_g1_i2.p1 TRINITY_DN7293_c0_g1~~TRINITY_DN7293_c0_g1_i2.p1  ORF type:complete len:150 (-),score=36.01 TRINITY_DN7293_c0_g1_i2:231-680(-)